MQNTKVKPLSIPLPVERAIHLFGELARFSNLMDTAQEDIGLTLIDEQLPKRIRQKGKPDTGAM